VAPRLDRTQEYLALEAGALAAFERAGASPASSSDEALVESGAWLGSKSWTRIRVRRSGGLSPLGDRGAARRPHVSLARRGRARFRASVSAITADAAQISGVHPRPAAAARLRGAACPARGLLERTQAICLFVNDINLPALASTARWDSAVISLRRSLFYDAPR
jgi:hypothetical protein